MQKNALNKDSIDWVEVRQQTLARAKDAKTTFDTYPAIVFALTQLKEHHSFLQLPDRLGGAQRAAINAEISKLRDSTESKKSANLRLRRGRRWRGIWTGAAERPLRTWLFPCVFQNTRSGRRTALISWNLRGSSTELCWICKRRSQTAGSSTCAAMAAEHVADAGRNRGGAGRGRRGWDGEFEWRPGDNVL